MEWVIHLLRQHSELAIFLTIAAGFWIGKMKIKQFSLGIVTSVLLVGVLVGQRATGRSTGRTIKH